MYRNCIAFYPVDEIKYVPGTYVYLSIYYELFFTLYLHIYVHTQIWDVMLRYRISNELAIVEKIQRNSFENIFPRLSILTYVVRCLLK